MFMATPKAPRVKILRKKFKRDDNDTVLCSHGLKLEVSVFGCSSFRLQTEHPGPTCISSFPTHIDPPDR